MPCVFSDESRLAEKLISEFSSGALIGIDGWIGVRKSSLAKRLVSLTGGVWIEVDDFLKPDQQKYVDALACDDLKDAIQMNSGQLILLDCICLREVLSRLDKSADQIVYVKRMTSWGWADGPEFNSSFENAANPMGACEAELVGYHKKWSPDESADIEFHWFDSPEKKSSTS